MINPSSETQYKHHIFEKIPGIDFAKQGPKPQVIFSEVTKTKYMAQVYEGTKFGDEFNILFNASQIIRREITETKDWNFTGLFED